MQKRYFTIGLALVLMLAVAVGRAEAKQGHFISLYAGSLVGGVIDTNGDGRTTSVFTGIMNTTLGRFFFQAEDEYLPPLATNANCPAGTREFLLLQEHVVLTQQTTGEQLLLTYTSGTVCFDPKTLTATVHAQGTFSGGTGRFVNATGSFEDNGTETILVFDPQGHNLGNSTGTLTGTLTGVGDGGD
jgi:hypothetical protein